MAIFQESKVSLHCLTAAHRRSSATPTPELLLGQAEPHREGVAHLTPNVTRRIVSEKKMSIRFGFF
jgi:hypothetical protein